MHRLVTPAAKIVAVAVAVGLGALAAFGCVIATLFEVQGFGGPRDQGPRTGYLVELGLALVAAVLLPVLIWRRLLGSGPGWILAGLVAAAGVVLLLGISLTD